MPVDATIGLFTEHVSSRFMLRMREGGGVDLELAQATPLAQRATGSGREPFSLLFRGPARVDLPQGTYRLEHQALGSVEIFLVPVGPLGDSRFLHFEAIFN